MAGAEEQRHLHHFHIPSSFPHLGKAGLKNPAIVGKNFAMGHRSLFGSLLAASVLALPLGAKAEISQPEGAPPASQIVPQDSSHRSISGLFSGIPWAANNLIVGATSTATQAGGGNPIFNPTMPAYAGVATLLITKGSQGSFICSGSLLDDRRSILTAAHCISDNLGNLNATAASAYFYDGSLTPPYDPDTVVWSSPASTAVNVSNYFIAPGYSGAVIENDDIAVLRLSSEAPSFATSYGLYVNNLMSTSFNVAGYGQRSNVGGNVGANQASGLLRQGDNRYEFQWSDPNFNNAFTVDPDFINGANTWVADFDNGLAANDAGCIIAADTNPSLANNPTYCNLGVGAKEAAIASGDSGSPGFVNGAIASISSYGLSFGPTYGDINSGLNASFGEFSGYVPVSSHVAFIESVKVPGPLPIAGAATMFSWSRRLRRRIAATRRSPISA
jgi:hypothetical protein